MVIRAVIYVPEGRDAKRWKRVCIDYCQRQGYVIVAAVTGGPDGGDRWMDLRRMAAAEEFDVLVVGRRDHLPAQRRPRIEAVEDGSPHGPQGRPRRLR